MSKHKLKLFGESMLREWFQPDHNMVWSESKVFSRLNSLKLTTEQQCLVDSGIRMDHWALGKTHASKPFNDLQLRLIASINANRQASAILLTNVDHTFSLDQILASAHPDAFMPKEERDLFKLDPAPIFFGDLNPNYTGLLFPDSRLGKPDLASLLDTVPENIGRRVLLKIEEVNTRNLERVQNLDSRVRDIYSIVAGLVNDGMDVTRGYGKLVSALDV